MRTFCAFWFSDGGHVVVVEENGTQSLAVLPRTSGCAVAYETASHLRSYLQFNCILPVPTRYRPFFVNVSLKSKHKQGGVKVRRDAKQTRALVVG